MISISNLKFQYSKSKLLFKDLNLQLKPGNIYGLLGKNGAGKTSLLKIVQGLIFPAEGNAEAFHHISSNRHPDLLKEIYFVQEEHHPVNLSILEYLYTYAPFYPNFDYDQFFKLLTSFDLEGNLKMDKLSHGQKKKVILCFAVSTNSKILILDEPTNGLDIPSKAQFRNLITDAMLDDRIIIISTHQVRDMVNLIDPILILDEGKIIFNYSIEEISKILKFELHQSLSEPKDVLYFERIAGGYLSITENINNEYSQVDVEILFNAILSKKTVITALFSKLQK
jgi:ABC-2 type transport system ATP-binding protein